MAAKSTPNCVNCGKAVVQRSSGTWVHVESNTASCFSDTVAEPKVEIPDLTLTQTLVMETLAARHRLGEQVWTFVDQRGLKPTLDVLHNHNLIGYKSGVVEKTFFAWFSDKGRELWLSEDYVPPIIAGTYEHTSDGQRYPRQPPAAL